MKKFYTGVLAMALACSANAQSIAYSLDKNYKGKGYQFNDPNPVSYSTGSADAILLNDDGTEYVGIKQLFAGDQYAITVLVKNKANGTRDSSFATNGIATENIQRGMRVTDIALLGGGKIYCSGTGWGGYVWGSNTMSPQIFAGGVVPPYLIAYDGCKHNSNTVVQVGDENVIAFFIDNGANTTNTYSNDGYAYVTYPTLSANTPKLQRVASVLSGSYYVAGVVDSFAFIAKYKHRTFDLDSTWGTNGVVSFETGDVGGASYFSDLKIQPDGKVVAIFNGAFNGSNIISNFILRYTTTGVADNAFNTNGKLELLNCNRVAFLPTNEIALLHQYDFVSTHQAGIIHLSNSGTVLQVADFSLPTASGTNQENTPLAISANAAGDIAISGIMLDSASNTDKFFTMRLKRNVCNTTGTITNVGGTSATVTFSNTTLPIRVVVGDGDGGITFDQTVTSGNSVTATGLSPETAYVVQVIEDNSCTWQTTFTTTDGSVGINDVANNISFSIYPNPTKEFLTIACNDEVEAIEIYNVLGECVKLVRGAIKQISVSDLSSGIYTLHLSAKNGHGAVKKFVKE